MLKQVLENYIQRLNEAYYKIDELPEDLLEFLYKFLPARLKKTFTRDDIMKMNFDCVAYYRDLSRGVRSGRNVRPGGRFDSPNKSVNDDNAKEVAQKARRQFYFIKQKDLFCIYPYGNGDHAWFSIEDKMVYDDNSELGLFNYLAIKEKRKTLVPLWEPVDYKRWIKDVATGKHKYAYKR